MGTSSVGGYDIPGKIQQYKPIHPNQEVPTSPVLFQYGAHKNNLQQGQPLKTFYLHYIFIILYYKS